jgi:tetratricopeptide (TPR) repeat protein
MRLSSALLCAGRRDEAVQVLGRLEDAAPSAEAASFFRGLSWLARGQIDAAQGSLLRASTSKECTPALSALAALHAHRGRPTDALGAAQEVLEADPQDIQALLTACDSAQLAGRTAIADEYLSRALDVQADCVPALLWWFERCLRGADPNQAVAALKRLQRAAPDLPEVKCGLVALHQARGRVAQARRSARLLVEEHPTHAAAWLTKARLAFEHDERDAALRSIHRALELAPDDVESAMEALRIQGELMPGGLDRLAHRLLQRFPDHWQIVSSAAMALAAPAGHPGWAAALAEHARRLEPRLPLSWLNRAEVLAGANHLDEALHDIETGLSLLPPDDGHEQAAPALLLEGALHQRRGQLPRAVEAFERAALAAARTRSTYLARALFWEASAFEGLGLLDRAAELYHMALRARLPRRARRAAEQALARREGGAAPGPAPAFQVDVMLFHSTS